MRCIFCGGNEIGVRKISINYQVIKCYVECTECDARGPDAPDEKLAVARYYDLCLPPWKQAAKKWRGLAELYKRGLEEVLSNPEDEAHDIALGYLVEE